jgi:hypothetical protein
LQISIIRQNKKEYYLQSKIKADAKQIMKVLYIKNLPDLIPKGTLNQYL